MISSVRGRVLGVGLDHVVVEVGGVGLAVQATPATLATLRTGEEATLSTALVVREDSLTLFGFADQAARDLFGLLQTVSGIGPRIALATLAVLDPEQLRAALAEGNLTVLTQVPGIGRKGAERMVIELRDKVGALPAAAAPSVNGAVRGSVVEALVGLGFPAKQAEQAVDEANAHVTDPAAHLARALCVFIRFAIDHRESAQVLWRLNSGVTMVDAPINRNLRNDVQAGITQQRFKRVDIEVAALLVMGTIVISLRHALEDRLVTPPINIAKGMAAGLLRSLGVPAAQADRLACEAADDILRPQKSTLAETK